jgi:hypothetical protein
MGQKRVIDEAIKTIKKLRLKIFSDPKRIEARKTRLHAFLLTKDYVLTPFRLQYTDDLAHESRRGPNPGDDR